LRSRPATTSTYRPGGLVFVRGELWRAHSNEPLAPGERVRVDRLDGLTVDVHRV
jgi:membrane protein implicated in regulation of membrane protease activity